MKVLQSSARLSALITAALLLTAPAHAQETARPAVVELFTSQGCSSCPAADEAFARLADDPGVIALAYHVTYWDYIGWRDTAGTPEGTQRQYDYMRAFANNAVYTPQLVVNGNTQAKNVKGFDAAVIEARKRPPVVAVSLRRTGDLLEISAGAGQGEGRVIVAFFSPELPVAIERGENAGKTMVYRNAVRMLRVVGVWRGKPMHYAVEAGQAEAAVLLQAVSEDGTLGPILGASATNRPSPDDMRVPIASTP